MNKSLTKTYNWITLRLICARFSVVFEISTEFYMAFPEIMVIFAILFGYRYLNNSVFGFVMLLGYCILLFDRYCTTAVLYLRIAKPYQQTFIGKFSHLKSQDPCLALMMKSKKTSSLYCEVLVPISLRSGVHLTTDTTHQQGCN